MGDNRPGRSVLVDLGLAMPVLVAPMAGGPSTTTLVRAAAAAGSIGLLAAGYKTPEAMLAEIAATRAAGVPFGVNLFAPPPIAVDGEEFRRYARAIQVEADAYTLDLGRDPIEDDDHWSDKIDALLTDPVPLVSFTFGIPDRTVIASLRAAGTLVMQRVTTVDEALAGTEAGADLLAVQGAAAGGHSGTLTPHAPPPPIPIAELVARIRHAVTVPLIAAGGLSTAADVTAVIGAGAVAAMVGTVLLRTDESGTSATYRGALAAVAARVATATATAGDTDTVVTRAFTGRPARALRNLFTDRYGALAPLGYPAVHHLTSALRKAAAAAGDADRVNLWAGTGYRHATAEPVAGVLVRLAERV